MEVVIARESGRSSKGNGSVTLQGRRVLGAPLSRGMTGKDVSARTTPQFEPGKPSP